MATSSAEQLSSLATCVACRRAGRSFAAQAAKLAGQRSLLINTYLYSNHSPTPRKNRFVPVIRITAAELVPSVNWNPAAGNAAQLTRSLELSIRNQLVPQSSTPSITAGPE